MPEKTAYVDHRELARQFREGDIVRFPNISYREIGPVIGRVTAVLDKIGMVDVETPYGNIRVEPDQILKESGTKFEPSYLRDTSYQSWEIERAKKVASRVTEKQALYWKEVGRVYTPTRQENMTGIYTCPKCCGELERARYKKGETLYVCPLCLWMIRPEEICIPCEEEGNKEEKLYNTFLENPQYFNKARNVVYRWLRPGDVYPNKEEI